MERYILKSPQEGIAVARAYRVDDPDVPSENQGSSAVSLEEAVAGLKEDLLSTAAVADVDYSEMLEAQIMLLRDPSFSGRALALVRDEGMEPIQAVEVASRELEEEFAANANPIVRGRTADVRGLRDELIARLTGQKRDRLSEPVILAGEEISPAFLLQLDRSLISGIVTAKGSATSHLAVLAGNYGIPYLYGSRDAVAQVNDGDRLIIDGTELITEPDDATLQEALRKAELRSESAGQASGTGKTRIYANVGSLQDVEAAVAADAGGIGLMRTEFLFLKRDTEPSEDEQYEVYRRAAELMGTREMTIRTMDIGADKKAPWLPMADEINPALGCRGIRVSLANEAVFRKQVRALLRAAAVGNIKIMLPMIAAVWEYDEVSRIIGSCADELERDGTPYRIPEVGVMIETPAAVMMAPELAEKAAFFSVGTNDLTQYTMALDRESNDPGRYEESGIEPVLRLVSMLVKAAHEHGVTVSVCGELAGNSATIRRFIEAGVDKLSVSVSKLEATRAKALEAEQTITAAKALKEKHATAAGQAREAEQAIVEATVSAGFDIVSPVDGTVVPMEEIPDPAFSSGSLGKCLGILPENGTICAPCDGVITGIAETGHAFTVERAGGGTILVHVGIDTVGLGGKGFSVNAAVGDRVTAGQPVLEADIETIAEAGLSSMVIVVCME